jgi:hypothetical protein
MAWQGKLTPKRPITPMAADEKSSSYLGSQTLCSTSIPLFSDTVPMARLLKDLEADDDGPRFTVKINLTPTGKNVKEDPVLRELVLDQQTPKVEIGRSSGNKSKGLCASQDNMWLNSPVVSRSHATFELIFPHRLSDKDNASKKSNETGVVSHSSKSFLDSPDSQIKHTPESQPILVVTDLGSTHGTFIDKLDRLTPNEPVELPNNCSITFGTEVIRGLMACYPRSFDVSYTVKQWEPLTPKSHLSVQKAAGVATPSTANRGYSIDYRSDEDSAMDDGGEESYFQAGQQPVESGRLVDESAPAAIPHSSRTAVGQKSSPVTSKLAPSNPTGNVALIYISDDSDEEDDDYEPMIDAHDDDESDESEHLEPSADYNASADAEYDSPSPSDSLDEYGPDYNVEEFFDDDDPNDSDVMDPADIDAYNSVDQMDPAFLEEVYGDLVSDYEDDEDKFEGVKSANNKSSGKEGASKLAVQFAEKAASEIPTWMDESVVEPVLNTPTSGQIAEASQPVKAPKSTNWLLSKVLPSPSHSLNNILNHEPTPDAIIETNVSTTDISRSDRQSDGTSDIIPETQYRANVTLSRGQQIESVLEGLKAGSVPWTGASKTGSTGSTSRLSIGNILNDTTSSTSLAPQATNSDKTSQRSSPSLMSENKKRKFDDLSEGPVHNNEDTSFEDENPLQDAQPQDPFMGSSSNDIFNCAIAHEPAYTSRFNLNAISDAKVGTPTSSRQTERTDLSRPSKRARTENTSNGPTLLRTVTTALVGAALGAVGTFALLVASAPTE